MYLFFFFKQKTAYEMRISDWSSDVCSSDLTIDLQEIRPVVRDTSVLRHLLATSDSLPEDTVFIVATALDFGGNVDRSEERRGGKECVSTCRSGWSPFH